MAAETEKATPPAPAAPSGGAKPKDSKRMLVIGIAAVALVAVVGFFMMGGRGDKKKEDSSGGDRAGHPAGAREAKLPLGPQVVMPDMTFEMSSNRTQYLLLKISVVLVLKRSDMAEEDPKIRAKELKIEEGVNKMVPWIQQQVTNIIWNIPLEDRDQLLYEDGARRLADELKSIVNKRFKGEFEDDVVEEVWLPVRRPADR